jgi:hypothetical protein
MQAYQIKNNDALIGASRLIARLLKIKTPSRPTAEECLMELQKAAQTKGVETTSDPRTGRLDFSVSTGRGRLTVKLDLWSPTADTRVTITNKGRQTSRHYAWNGIKMVALSDRLLSPRIPGLRWLRRITG